MHWFNSSVGPRTCLPSPSLRNQVDAIPFLSLAATKSGIENGAGQAPMEVQIALLHGLIWGIRTVHSVATFISTVSTDAAGMALNWQVFFSISERGRRIKCKFLAWIWGYFRNVSARVRCLSPHPKHQPLLNRTCQGVVLSLTLFQHPTPIRVQDNLFYR